MVSNTGSRAVGGLLMMPRTWEVALSRSRYWLSSREVAVCWATASLSLRSAVRSFCHWIMLGSSAAALGSIHRGSFGGIGGSSLRPARQGDPCLGTRCAAPHTIPETIYGHIPRDTDGNCLHPFHQVCLCFRKRGATLRNVLLFLSVRLPVQSQPIAPTRMREEQKSLWQRRWSAYECASKSSLNGPISAPVAATKATIFQPQR